MDGRQALTLAFSPCIGGLNTRDAIDAMPPEDARDLVNIFPDRTRLRLRRGYTIHQEGFGGAVETLIRYTKSDGTEELLAAAKGSLFNASALLGSPETLNSGFTSNKWQHVQYRDRIILVNGEDTPQIYDGSTMADTAFTDVPDVTKLIGVTAYRSRLYYCEKDTLRFWYGLTDSFSGELSSFDISSICMKGGHLMSCSKVWGANSEGGIDEHFALITSEGEVLVYSGSNPDDADNWFLVGRFTIPQPLGRKSAFELGTETYVLTVSGIVPLGRAMAAGEQFSQTGTLTDKINTRFNDSAENHIEAHGWETAIIPDIRHLIVNVPSGNKFIQYVMNIESGAWTVYNKMEGISWVKFNNKPYFSTASGKVFRANSGFDDDGAFIGSCLKTAFSYMGEPVREKIFQMSKLLVETNVDFEAQMYLNADGFDESKTDEVCFEGGTGGDWDKSSWDNASWGTEGNLNKKWESTPAQGRNASLVLKANTSGVTYSILGHQVMLEAGGAL